MYFARPDDLCAILGGAVGGCFTGALVAGAPLPMKGGRLGPSLKVGGFPWKEPETPVFNPVGAIVKGLIGVIANRFGVACSVSPQVFG